MLIIKYRKIFKIFCKYNFWWNVLKSKKFKNIFFKLWDEKISEYLRIHLYEKFWEKTVNFPNISEYF